MRKVPIKEILTRRMREAGVPSVPELSRRAQARGFTISETGIKAMMKPVKPTKDPQVFTIEAIAAGLDVSPLRIVAEMLGIDPDDPNLKADDFRIVWEAYKDLSPSQQKAADPHVAGLLMILKNLKNIKSQSR